MYWTIEYLYNRGIVTVEEFKSCSLELDRITDKDDTKKEKAFWTLEEFEKFIDTFDDDDKYKYLFEVLGHLGCRIGEIRGLQVKHYNPIKKEIFICQQVTSKLDSGKWEITTTKTKKSIRHVTVSDRIASLLDELIKDMGYNNESFLFLDLRLLENHPSEELWINTSRWPASQKSLFTASDTATQLGYSIIQN